MISLVFLLNFKHITVSEDLVNWKLTSIITLDNKIQITEVREDSVLINTYTNNTFTFYEFLTDEPKLFFRIE